MNSQSFSGTVVSTPMCKAALQQPMDNVTLFQWKQYIFDKLRVFV